MTGPPVVLLHGLGQTPFRMARLEKAFQAKGRQTLNLSYPSRGAGIRQLAGRIWNRMRESFPDGERFDFITHSTGGIIARQIAADHPGAIRRAVMIGPPNGGTELADFCRRTRLFRWLAGPVALELGCGPDSLPNRLGQPDFEAGVIAGSRPDNPFSRFVIPGEEDGRVGVARTALVGMADWVVVPYGHVSIMMRAEVIRLAEHFLREGRFPRNAGKR